LAELNLDSPLRRAISYLKREQEADGSWYGRWGVNYIYGTGLVLASLQTAKENMRQDHLLRTVSWLVSCQNQDGGWGETCHSYENPFFQGIGPSTASQTAWALLGLIAAGEQANPVVRRGIQYLINSQKGDGAWWEDAYTGTGFPRAFYLRYDLYRLYFPLLAIGQYKSFLEGTK
jgi:squalene-hopene/tetraprenyl-beta-curcumene cyclase